MHITRSFASIIGFHLNARNSRLFPGIPGRCVL